MKLKAKDGKQTQLLIGLIMVLIGLILFSSHIYVASNRFSRGLTIGSVTLNSGMIMLPFIIGVILMFLLPKKKWPKVLSVIGFLIMIIFSMFLVNLRVSRMSVIRWLLILILIFGGIVLVLRSLTIELKKRSHSSK